MHRIWRLQEPLGPPFVLHPPTPPPPQDVLFEDMFAAEPPPGAERWEAKLCEYSALPLKPEQWRAIVDGWLTWPAYPEGYPEEGGAWTYSYLEGQEGALCLL